MIRIEKDIPAPPVVKERTPNHYPWRQMEVGDSFETTTSRTSMHTLGKQMGRNIGARFVAKTQDNGMTRVWRVE